MNKIFDYKNLILNELIEKISDARFFHLPKMVAEALDKLLGRVEILENTHPPTGDFIPLTGTEVGSPVTGDIEFNAGTISFKSSGSEKIIEMYDDGGEGLIKLRQTDDINIYNKITHRGLELNNGNGGSNFRNRTDGLGIEISNINFNAIGLSGNQNFTANITDLDYTQKIYIDERGSVLNPTTSVLSASDLNTAYPNAKDGFSVIAPNVVGGGKYYIKAGAGWVYQQILAVV